MISVLTPCFSRQKQVLDYLEKQGVSTELILEIYARISQSPDTPILKILSQAIKIQSWMEKFTPQKIHAFTGPSGSGQTSTLLRLALELKIICKNFNTQRQY